MAILTLTTTVAVTVFNPEPHRQDAARLQLEQIKNAIETHNSRFFQDYTDANLKNLSGLIKSETIEDPWGNAYLHNYGGGFVYSRGPDGHDDGGKGDDIVLYYRPPTAAVIERGPVPSSTTDTAAPLLFATWGMTRLRGTGTETKNSITAATFFVDNKAVPGRIEEFAGAAIKDPSGERTRVQVSYKMPSPLPDGKHTVRVEILDAASKPARAAWYFTVDTHPPTIFSMNPTNGATLTAPPSLVSALFTDPAGINLKHAYFSFVGPSGFKFEHDVAKQNTMPTPASGLYLTQQSMRYTPPTTLVEGHYTVDLRVVDGVWSDTLDSTGKSHHQAEATWGFDLQDKSKPQIAVLQPAYGTTVTTSDDLDPKTPDTVELMVLGTSDASQKGVRETQIELRVDPGSPAGDEPKSATSITTMADETGRFRYPQVGVGGPSQSGTHPTSSTIWVRAVRIKHGELAADTYTRWLPTLVNVYNHPEDTVLLSARAVPTTTEPNRPVMLYYQVDRGSPPFDFRWDFGDGQQEKGVRTTLGPLVATADPKTPGVPADPKTTGTAHSYLSTGTFNALITVTDARGLSAGKLLPIYVGTESEVPRVFVTAEPFAFRFTKDPNAVIDQTQTKTFLNCRIEGKFLGEWRLKVQDKPVRLGAQFQKYVWFYDNREIDPVNEGFDYHWDRDSKRYVLARTPPRNSLDLENDKPHGDTWNRASSNSFRIPWTGRDNTLGDEANKVEGLNQVVPFPGNVLDKSNPAYAYTVVLEYKDAFSVDGIPPTTYATCQVQVFNGAPAPGNMRIVSVKGDPYSLQLYDADGDGRPDFTNSLVVDVAIDRPKTTNTQDLWISNYPLDMRWLAPDGVAVDTKVHPSNLPATHVTTETPGGYVFMNWTLADGQAFDKSDGSTGWIPLVDSNLSFHDWPLTAGAERLNFPAYAGQMNPYVPGSKSSGLRLTADGRHYIYVIFRSAGPFVSTELDNFLPTDLPKPPPSTAFTKGVTSTSIIFDQTGPSVMAPSRIIKVQVDRTKSIVGTVVVTATDSGSGMTPRGKILITTPTQRVPTFKPYATTFTHNFGPLSDLGADGVIKATLVFQDNLGNSSSPGPDTTASFSQASAALTSFTWSIIGSGDLTYFQTRDRPPAILGLSDIDNGSPFVEQWRRNGVKLSPNVKFEDAFASDAPQFLSVENFPNPDDRLAVLDSRRPNSSTNDNEVSFPVDNLHRYFLALVKGQAEVEYRVYETPSGTSISDAAQLDKFTVVASVNRVADPNFENGRVNEGIMVLPDQVASGQAPGRAKDLHDAGGSFASSEVWDRSDNLLISTNPSDFATYPYKGVITGFNSGVVTNAGYHVTSNRFRVRVGFMPPKSAYSLADIVPPSSRTLKGDDIKTRTRVLAIQAPPTVEGAAGVHPDFPLTQILDVPDKSVVGAPDLTTGTVSGTVFRVEFANYSNAFEMMTTGSVSAAVRVEFTGTVGTTAISSFTYVGSDGSLYEPASAANSATLLTSAPNFDFNEVDGRKMKPKNFQYIALTDVRGTPRIFSPNINWPFLDGKVGQMKIRVWYRDEKLEILPPLEATATVDSAVPTNVAQNGSPNLWLEALSPKRHVDRGSDGATWTYGTSGALASGKTRWTSTTDLRATYDVRDDGDVLREHTDSLSGPYSGIPAAVALDTAHDGAANSGPDDGSRPGRLARWKLIKPKSQSKTDLVSESFALVGSDAPKELNFRIRDNNFNIFPEPSPPPPDPGQPTAPTIRQTLYLDRTPPKLEYFYYTTSPVSPQYANSLRKLKIVTEVDQTTAFWTNDTQPRFQWKFTDPGFAATASDTGVGVKGVNMALSQSGGSSPVSQLFPVQHVPGTAGIGLGVDVDVSHPSSQITSLTPNGKKTLTLQAVDALSNYANVVTTDVWVDTFGPTLSTAAGKLQVRSAKLTRKTVLFPSSGFASETRAGPRATNPDIAISPAMRVTDVRFQPVSNQLSVGNLVLKNGSTQLTNTLNGISSSTITTFAPFVWQVSPGSDGKHPLASALQWDSNKVGAATVQFYIEIGGYDDSAGVEGGWVDATNLTTATTVSPMLDLQWQEIDAPGFASDGSGVGVHHTYTASGVADAIEWRYRWSGGVAGQLSGNGSLAKEEGDLSSPTKSGFAVPANSFRSFALAGRDRLTNLGPFATFFTFRFDASEPVPVLTLKPKVPPVFSAGATFFTSVMTLTWNDVDDVPDPSTLGSYRVYFHHFSPSPQSFVSTATVADTSIGNTSFAYSYTHPLKLNGPDDDTNTYTIRPVDRFGTEQQQANNVVSVYYDNTTPTIDPFDTQPTSTDIIGWTTRTQTLNTVRSTGNLRLTTGDKYYWTNVMPVHFAWVGRDLARFSVYRPHTEEGSGIKGYNTAFPDGPSVTQPPGAYPPAILSTSGQSAVRDESAKDPLTGGGKDGAKTFTVQATDLVGSKSTLFTTTYWLDTTGPTIKTANLGLVYNDNRQTIVSGGALPITTITSASSITMTWAQIQTAATDGAGIGVHNTDTAKNSNDAREWQYSYTLQQSTGTQPSTVSPTFTFSFGTTSSQSMTATTGATQLKLAIDKLGTQSVQSISIVSVSLYALDRLTNIGPPVQIVKMFRDSAPPNPLLSLAIPTPTSSVVATWANVNDVGNAGTDRGWFSIYRNPLLTLATPAPNASRVSTLRTTSPFSGTNIYFGTRPVTTLASALAGVGDAGRTSGDGLYYYRVQPIDNIGNEQTAGNVTVPILFDTTQPIADKLDWRVASSPPVGTLTISRITTQSAGVNWTNDTRPNFLWRGRDLAFYSTVSPNSAGSGILGSNYSIVNGLTGTAPSSSKNVQVTTAAPVVQSYGSQGPATSVFSIWVADNTPTALAPDGAKTFEVNAVDRLGFVATPVTTQFYLDVTGPNLVSSALGLRIAYFNGTPTSWSQTLSSVTARPWASLSRTFPVTIAVSGVTVAPTSATEPIDLRKFYLYKDGVQVASLGDLTDKVTFSNTHTADDINDAAFDTNVVQPLSGTYSVTKVQFVIAKTGANPSNIQFQNVRIRDAGGTDATVSSPAFTLTTTTTTKTFSGLSLTGCSLVFDRKDLNPDTGCTNCDTDYVVKVFGTRFGHTSANEATYTTPALIFANKIAWDHQEPYSGTPNPSYKLTVTGKVDQGLASYTATPAPVVNVSANATLTAQSIAFSPQVVTSVTVSGASNLRLQNLRLRVAANNIDDTTPSPATYSALPQTVNMPAGGIWADRVLFDIQNTDGSAAHAATFSIAGSAFSAAVFNPAGGSPVSVGANLPPTNALTLRALWNPITGSYNDGSGVGLSDSPTAKRWSYSWTSTAGNAPQDIAVEQADLPLPPSSTCNFLKLAGRDKLTNRGPFDLLFQLSLDNVPPTISSLSAFRSDGGVETDITALDSTWISTNVVRYAFVGTDQTITCGTVTGVQLRGFSYSFGEGVAGPVPDTAVDPVVPPSGQSAGNASVTTSWSKPGGSSRIFQVALVDNAGNPSVTSQFTIHVDTEKPTAAIVAPPIALNLSASPLPPLSTHAQAAARTLLATHFPSGILTLSGAYTETISSVDPNAEPQPTPADLRVSTDGGTTYNRFSTLLGNPIGQGVGQAWTYNWTDPRLNSVAVTLVASVTDQAGNNTKSTTVAVFVDTVLPAQVVSVAAPTPTSTIRLTWNNTFGGDPSGPGTYRIYRNTTLASIGSQVATTLSTAVNPNLYEGSKPKNLPLSLRVNGTEDGSYWFTVRPVDIPGNETLSANTTSPVLYDTTVPVLDKLAWKAVSAPKGDGTLESTTITRTTTSGSSANWTNETTPQFNWRVTDYSRYSTVVATTTAGSGVAGVNFTLNPATVAVVPSGVSPTDIVTGSTPGTFGVLGPALSQFELSRNSSRKVPALGIDGPKTFAFRAVDRVNLSSTIDSQMTTTFWLDTAGPSIVSAKFGGTLAFNSGSQIDQTLRLNGASEGAFVTGQSVPLVASQYVSSVTLTPAGGPVDFRNVQLKDGSTAIPLSSSSLTVTTVVVSGSTSSGSFTFTSDQDLANGLEVTNVKVEYVSGAGGLGYRVVRLETSNNAAVSPDVNPTSSPITLSSAGAFQNHVVADLPADKIKAEFFAGGASKTWRLTVTGRRIRRNDAEAMTFSISPAVKADTVVLDSQDISDAVGLVKFDVVASGRVTGAMRNSTVPQGSFSPIGSSSVYRYDLPRPVLASSVTVSAAGGVGTINDVTLYRAGVVVGGGTGTPGGGPNVGLPATFTPAKAVWIDRMDAKVATGPPTAPLKYTIAGQEIGGAAYGLTQALSIPAALAPTNAFSVLLTFNDAQTSLDDGAGIGTLDTQSKRWNYTWNLDGTGSPVSTSAASIELPLPLGTQCANFQLAGRDRLTNLGPYSQIFTITVDNTPPQFTNLKVVRHDNNAIDVTPLANQWLNTNRLDYILTGTDTGLLCLNNAIELRGWSYTFGQGLPGVAPDVSIEKAMNTAGSVTVLGPVQPNGQYDLFRCLLIDAGGNFSPEQSYVAHIDTEFPLVGLAASPFSKSRPVASAPPLLLSTHFPVVINGAFTENVSSVARAPGTVGGNNFLPQTVSNLDVRLEFGKYYGYSTLSPGNGLTTGISGTWTLSWPLSQVSTLNGSGIGGNGRVDIVPRATDQAGNVTPGTTVTAIVDTVLPASLGVASLARVSPATTISMSWPNTFDSPAPKDPSGPGRYWIYRTTKASGVPVQSDYGTAAFVAEQNAVTNNVYAGSTVPPRVGNDLRLLNDGTQDGHYFFDIHPVDTPDGVTPGNENTGLTTHVAIRFDTTPPTISLLKWSLATANRGRTTTQPGSFMWTNETTPAITWKGEDLAYKATNASLKNKPGAGLSGSSYALANSFAFPAASSAVSVTTASSLDPLTPSAGRLGPSTSAFILSSASAPRVPPLGADGPKSFSFRTVDVLSQASTPSVTQFILDTAPPTPVTSITVSSVSPTFLLGVSRGPNDGTGIISRIAGTGSGGTPDIQSTGLASTLPGLRDVAVAPGGDIWITDDSAAQVLRLGTDGTFKSLATATAPNGIAVDRAGNAYVADTGANKVLRIDAVTQGVTVVPFASLSSPTDVACDSAGNVYVADRGNDRVKKWTVATRVESNFGSPIAVVHSLAFDAADNLYVARAGGVTKLTPAAAPSSISTVDADALASDASGTLFGVVTANDTVVKLATGKEIAGKPGTAGDSGHSGDGGPAGSALLNGPTGIAVDGAGNLIVADRGLFEVRRIGRGSGAPPPGNVGVRAIYTMSWLASSDSTGIAGITYDLIQGGSTWKANRTPPNYTVPSIAAAGTQRTFQWEVQPMDLLAGLISPTFPNQPNPSINCQKVGNQRIVVVEDLAAPISTTASIAAVRGRSVGSTFYTSVDFTVSWTASNDGSGGSGLAAYTLNRNSSPYARFASSVTNLTELQTALTNLGYDYEVVAEDAVTNKSTGNKNAKAFLDTVLPNAVAVSTATTAGILGTDALPATSSQVKFTWTTCTDTGFPSTGSGVLNYLVSALSAPVTLTTQTVALAPAPVPYTDTRGGLADGVYNFTVRGIDRAGNVAAPAAGDTIAVRLDKTPPAAVSASDVTSYQIPGAPPIPVTSAQVAFTWAPSSDLGSGLNSYRFMRQVNAGPNLLRGFVPTTTLAFTDTTATGDGTYYYQIQAMDQVKNVAPMNTWSRSPGVTMRIMLDKTAPSAVTPTFVQGEGATSGFTRTLMSLGLTGPAQTALDPSGNIYVADSGANKVFKITPAGITSTFAGTGISGFSGDGGASAAAKLKAPTGVAVDSTGKVYIADNGNHRIRIVDTAGNITTTAGTESAGSTGDNGLATSAKLKNPEGVGVDLSGNLYIADQGNHEIRRVDAVTRIITLFAGTGSSGFSGDLGAATSAKLNSPAGVTVDGAGNVFIADSGNNRIRKVNTGGTISTIAGTGTGGFSGDGGAATAAKLQAPEQVAVDGSGAVFIADLTNKVIRRIDPVSLNITTTAGKNGVTGYGGDGVDAATIGIDAVGGVALDPSGSVVASLTANARIVRIAPSGTSPGGGAIPTSRPFVLSWPAANDSTGSGIDAYEIWRSPAPSSAGVYYTKVSSTTLSFRESTLPSPDGLYTYEVRPIDRIGNRTNSVVANQKNVQIDHEGPNSVT
ncbi:MAG: PKD domain-containing protein, partial [Candidatus Wallbacteria bacterium]|nr:PKD domain-containing protein [Candidatus Wallbacteria bacterium]